MAVSTTGAIDLLKGRISVLKHHLSGYQVELNKVTESDLERLREWRNSDNVAQYMLTSDKITQEQQLAWFKKIERDERQQHYVISYKSQPIGAANIKAYYQGETLASARVIEPGLYIADDKYRNNILAFAPTLLLNDYCFTELGTQALRAVVKSDNQGALSYNEKLGYQIEKQAELVEICLTQSTYETHSKGLKALLSRDRVGAKQKTL